MANLMITYRCNLNCSYCFANSYVNHQNTDMTLDTAKEILTWLSEGGERTVGIMGGEPTIYPHLDEILYFARDKGIRCSLFTNGIRLIPWLDCLKETGARILINVNEQDKMGSAQYEELEKTFHELLNRGFVDRVTFGVNIYKHDYDYSRVIELMKRFHHHELRVSVTVPNGDQRNMDIISYMEGYMAAVRNLLIELAKINAYPSFDCNRIPACVLRSASLEDLPFLKEPGYRSNLLSGAVPCQPVIDILPDQTAIRCFGLSENLRVPIARFRNISHLRNYFARQFDMLSAYTESSEKCRSCYEHETGLCNGGCLVYQLEKIMNMRKALMKE